MAHLACDVEPRWFLFWEDYVDGKEPYFTVPDLVVGGSGGGDPASGSYPAEMLVDWVRVF